ncbi:MAG: hypothetical protein L3J61_00575 [Ghiorsea sp.]|nr:hypothetical protein [Ghiorsea sp.]
MNIQVSNLATTTVSGIEITTEKRQLSTWEDRGEPIVILQHFIEDNRVLIDVSDPNVERIVAQIRLFFATEDNEQALAGTMRIEGTGVFALSCEGP